MKKILTFLLIGAALSSSAQTPLMENFTFGASSNDSLAALTVNNGWLNTATLTTNAIRANAAALSYSGYVGSGTGYAAALTTSGQDVVKDAKTSYTSGSVYGSFLLNVSAAQAAGDYFFGFLPQTSTSTFIGRTFIKLSSTGYYKIGITKGSATLEPTPTYSTDSFALSTTYLCVVKYTFYPTTTTDDSLKIYMFSSGIPATEPATPRLATIGSTNVDATAIGRIFLRQGGATLAPTLTIGAIRLSNSWANGPLAVKINAFKGNLLDGKAFLNWSTSTETNNHGFEIERSYNGKDFETIGFVKGAGNSNKLNNYQFVDENVNANLAYYRLKQIDFDGKFEYIETITLQSDEMIIEVTPNPFAEEININAAQENENIIASVVDMNGTIIMNASSQGKLRIDTRNMAQGVYFVRVNNGEKVIVKRIIKN